MLMNSPSERSQLYSSRDFSTYDTLDGVHHTNMILLGLDDPPIVCLCSFYIISPIESPLPLVHLYDNSGRSLQNDCLDHIWYLGMVQNLSARRAGKIFSNIQGRRSLVGCLVDIWQISFLSDSSPIIVYTCQWLNNWLLSSRLDSCEEWLLSTSRWSDEGTVGIKVQSWLKLGRIFFQARKVKGEIIHWIHSAPDMRFVKKFKLPDFQAKNFTPLISPNFNSFGDTNTKIWVKMEIFTPLATILHCRRQWRQWQISPLLSS